MEGRYNMETLSVWIDDLLGCKKGQLNTFPVDEFLPYKDCGGWFVKIVSIGESRITCEHYPTKTQGAQYSKQLEFNGKQSDGDSPFSINWETEV